MVRCMVLEKSEARASLEKEYQTKGPQGPLVCEILKNAFTNQQVAMLCDALNAW